MNTLFGFDYLVIPSTLRSSFLRLKNEYPTSHVKFLTKGDFFDALDFKWTPACAIFLYETKGHSWAFIEKLRDSLHFLCQPNVPTEKVSNLIALKEEMRHQNLIHGNPYFRQQLLNKRIGVIGYLENDDELELFSDKLGVKFYYLHLPKVEANRQVSRFAFVEDEVAAFFNYLGEHGITTNEQLGKVKLLTPSMEYDYWLNVLAHLYQVPINLRHDTKLIALPLVQEFIDAIENGESFEIALDKLKDFPAIQRMISETLLTYPASQFRDYPKFLKEIFSSLSIPDEKYEAAIDLVDDFTFGSDDLLFVIGFNEDNFPAIKKNDDYLSDREKKSLGRLTSHEQNQRERSFIQEKIKASGHVIYSYAENTSSGPKYASNLLQTLEFTVLDYPRLSRSYSLSWAELYGSSLEDLHWKYGENAPELPAYKKVTQNAKYRKYDYHFYLNAPIHIKGKISLSYSRVNTFFQCPFHYYLDYIVKIDEPEDAFNFKIGHLLHAFLQKHGQEGPLDYDQVFDELVLQQNFTSEEMAFLPRIKYEFSFAYDFIKKHEASIVPDQIYSERFITIDLHPNLTLSGGIDRLYVFHDLEKELYVVVDYKTGSETYQEKNLTYGLSLQLPTYALLLKESPEFAQGEVIGLYIHQILNTKVGFDPKKSKEEHYQKIYQYTGLSIDDRDQLVKFDPTFQASEFISGLRINSNGAFHAHAKIKSSDGFADLATLAKEKYLEAERAIRNFEFPISPIKVNTVDACAYCPYRDICYRKNSDYRGANTEDETKDSDEVDTEERDYGL